MILNKQRTRIYCAYYGCKTDASLNGHKIDASVIEKVENGEYDASIIVKPITDIVKNKKDLRTLLDILQFKEESFEIGNIGYRSDTFHSSYHKDIFLIEVNKKVNELHPLTHELVTQPAYLIQFDTSDTQIIIGTWNGKSYDDDAIVDYTEIVDFLRRNGYETIVEGYYPIKLISEGIFIYKEEWKKL